MKWQKNLTFIKFTKQEQDSAKKKQNGLIIIYSEKSDEEFLNILKFRFNFNLSDDKLLKVIHLMKERATFPKDIYENGNSSLKLQFLTTKKHLKKHGMKKLLLF
jgi:hypothetical protein